MLATSREALRLQPEQRYALAPLDLPADGQREVVEHAAAGALFVERARTHDHGFELTDANASAIAEVCRRLDGLPLAIELAAARTAILGVEELNARLVVALDALGSGPRDAPDRQRTLRATIDWSSGLLSTPEAEAFAHFAVFAGGATTDAALQIAGADLNALEGLLDKQLLVRRAQPGADARLMMLETVREFAREQLEAHEAAPEIRERHVLYYLALAERAEPELDTQGDERWLPRLDAETDNFRAALDWSLGHGDPAIGLRLAGLLGRYWDIRKREAEGREAIEEALRAAGDEAPIRDRARAQRAQLRLEASEGGAYSGQRSIERFKARAAEALALSRQAGDPADVADALLLLAGFDMAESHPQRRRSALAEEALIHARQAGDDRLVAFALESRSLALSPQTAAVEFEAAADALRELGSTRALAMVYSNAAYNALKVDSGELARRALEQAVPLSRELGDPAVLVFVEGNVGLEALFSGDLERARAAFDEQLRLCREQALNQVAAEGLAGLAGIAAHRGDLERAARLLGAATAAGPAGDADVMSQFERRCFEPARAACGEQRWNEAHAAGARMGLKEAIAFALDPAAHAT